MDIAQVVTRMDLEAFHAVDSAAMSHDHVGLPADPIEEYLPLLDRPERVGELVQLYVGRVGDEPVGLVGLHLPTMDNLQVVHVDVAVHPRHRRQGHGRALADFVLSETRRRGRTRVFVEIASRPGQPPLAERLLQDAGARRVLDDVRRMLDLKAHPPAPRCEVPAGYRVVQWVDRAPEHLVDGCAYLTGRMSVDAPLGEMDWEQEKWDAARYRDKERAAIDRGRRRMASAAVHESGQVAGLTDIGVNAAAPEVGYQWDTIVDPDHRGHGLGLVLKTWNHALLAETVSGVRYLNTWNAASNEFMIRVNEAMGFEPVEDWGEYQLDL
jgi:GNAT superfamily N-acetyltransferase